ncbi:MAG: hypothetical protein HXX16_03185 [Bacteroidales bacterium]|nr:hypothetical protein [Bacteroidales bacterium]
MKWLFKSKKLDQTLVRLVKAINNVNSCSLVSPEDSRYYTTSLPFYNDFKLYTFIDLSFSPYLEMKLLDNGTHTIPLDGTQQPFLKANSISPLILTSKTVYQYTMLVLGNIQKHDNSYRLINSIDEIDFSSEPTKEQYQQLESSIKTPKIKKDKDSFLVKTTLLFADNVIEASIKVNLDGRIEILKEKEILNNMPVVELVLE